MADENDETIDAENITEPIDHESETTDDVDTTDHHDGPHISDAEALRHKALEIIGQDNMATIGVLTLHAKSRDIEIVIDGRAALHIIGVFLGRRQHADKLDHRIATARAGWVGFGTARLVAVSWFPGLALEHPHRHVIDPLRPCPGT